MCPSIALILLFLFLLLPAAAHAHQLGVSYTTLELTSHALVARVRMQPHDVVAVLGGEPGEGSAREVRQRSREVQLYVGNRFMIEANGVELKSSAVTVRVTGDGAEWAEIELVYPSPAPGARLGLRSTLLLEIDPNHAHMVTLQRPGGRTDEIVLKNAARIEVGAGASDDLLSQLARFLVLGVEHIFLGYDHILFLLALLLMAATFLDLVKIVSSFTIAHTITLIGATLDWVTLPGRLVESIIALSIVYVALENFVIKDTSRRWLLTFGFGLIHGFGFSSVLREMGLPSSGLVACLLSFNLGVELGQLIIVGLAFPVLRAMARLDAYDFVVRRGGSAAILMFGLYWFFERVFGS